MRDFKNIDYRMFEFVLLDPKAAYEFPLIIEALGLDKGYILIKNENAPFGKQIEAAIPNNFSRNKMIEVLELIEVMAIKGKGPLKLRLGSTEPRNLEARYLSDAQELSSKGFTPLCIVSSENVGKYEQRHENEAKKFLKKSMKAGKIISYPREPNVVGSALKNVFVSGIFSRYVKFISIVDPYVDVIGTHGTEQKDQVERQDTLQCIEKICEDLTSLYELTAGRSGDAPNLKVNIFFKVKQSSFSKQKFKDRFTTYINSSKHGFFKGPKRKIDLTFYGFSEKPKGQRFHLRWLFSDAFLINHSDGICSHNLRLEKKRWSTDKSEIVWSLIKTLDKDDLETSSTYEEDNPHATLDEFKKLYTHNTDYFESVLNRWPAPLFDGTNIQIDQELTEVN